MIQLGRFDYFLSKNSLKYDSLNFRIGFFLCTTVNQIIPLAGCLRKNYNFSRCGFF